jgi:hypothetical protein
MPEISRFYGIIIYMFFDDHAPPHFHVQYNEYNAIVEIESGEIIRGSLPPKQLKYVQVWADLHKDELSNNFEDLKTSNNNYNKIKPL